MALDLSFKQLIDAAEDGAATIGQPTCIAIDRIDEDPDQPRRSFDEQKLEELAESVRQHGVLQPIVLRQATDDLASPFPATALRPCQQEVEGEGEAGPRSKTHADDLPRPLARDDGLAEFKSFQPAAQR